MTLLTSLWQSVKFVSKGGNKKCGVMYYLGAHSHHYYRHVGQNALFILDLYLSQMHAQFTLTPFWELIFPQVMYKKIVRCPNCRKMVSAAIIRNQDNIDKLEKLEKVKTKKNQLHSKRNKK